MIKFICRILFFCCSISSYAHNANEAYFWYTSKENTIEVEAEFPWSIRNALLNFRPELKSSKSKKDFDTGFEDYVRANLILKNHQGEVLPLLNITFLPNNGHSHQHNYLIKFQGNELSQFTNTVMLDLYEKQVNYNFFKTKEGKEIRYKTNKDIQTITLPTTTNEFSLYIILTVFLVVSLGFAFYKIFKKK